ncbi:MAG TPA: hypothetical protein VFQ68_31510 [Streptosporangiaceae bacterium]|nr:hypothetical protein [Streptosporangiaceae bacterium]
MPSRANRRPTRSLARMARWLGFDRNPLRRGTGRVEAILRLILVILLVAVIPAAAVAAGRWAARQGSTVRTWIDRSGAVTDPPMGHRVIVGYVFVAVMATCQLSWLVLLAAVLPVRHALDRRRLNAWEAEWRASGPLWSDHCS